MGYMVHHAIIVTGVARENWMEPGRLTIEDAHAKAMRLCECGVSASVSPILGASINGYHTFIIGPDGSKAGWRDDQLGDMMRGAMVAWLSETSGFDWAEIQYGDEEGDDRVLTSSNLIQPLHSSERGWGMSAASPSDPVKGGEADQDELSERIDSLGDTALRLIDHLQADRDKHARAAVKAQLQASVLLEALKLLRADVADYPAWQRPCHALDVADAAIAKAAAP